MASYAFIEWFLQSRDSVWNELQLISGQVCAFDRPGFGLTTRLVSGEFQENPYTAEFAADLTIRIMDHTGIREAVLVGRWRQ